VVYSSSRMCLAHPILLNQLTFL